MSNKQVVEKTFAWLALMYYLNAANTEVIEFYE